MRVLVNGEPVDLAGPVSLADLAAPGPGTAVALNRVVVPRSRLAGVEVCHGDEIEVVTAVQGG